MDHDNPLGPTAGKPVEAGFEPDDSASASEISLNPTLSFAPEPEPRAAAIPPAIGGYRIVRRIGEGGMGIVYEAEQSSPRRRVALKVVRGGPFVDEIGVKMFRREAEALARLKHPNIGAIYEAGLTTDGQHFFAMELVNGPTLDRYLGSRPLDAVELRRRLRLFQSLCAAVHYAHQKGVIHRDLKPSNIIVTEEAASPGFPPSVKILDFGLARITDPDARSTTLLTEVGIIKGTLAYMSPEQTQGARETVDTRSDVYALGVILYEMVAGRRPYDLDRASLPEALRLICEEPPRPLVKRGAVVLDADVETIVMKALEKDPERRYGSAAGLGNDVGRYLKSQPILARPPSATYQLRKFAERNKALVLGLLATIFVLLAGVVVSSALGVREARQRHAAERAGYVANVTAAEAGLRLFEVAEVKRRLAACVPSLRGWEWRHLAFRSEMSERILTGHTARIYPVAVSPDGKLLASGGVDPENVVRLWDAATGAPVRIITAGGTTSAEHSAGVRSLAFSPDGLRLASASDDKAIRIWEVATGSKLLELSGHEARVNSVAFTSDGREVVSGSFDGSVRRWDAATGENLATLKSHEKAVWGVAVCDDGSRIVSGSMDNTVRIWERSTNRELLTLHAPDGVTAVACSPGSDTVAAAVADGSVRVWDARSGTPVGAPGHHEDVVTSVAFSADGEWLASGGKDRTVRLWDARTGESLATLVGHDNVVTSVAFDPTGAKLISGSWDRTVRTWTTDRRRFSSVLASQPGELVGITLAPDGSRILAGSRDDGIGVLDAQSGAELARISGRPSPLLGFALSPDGRCVAEVHPEGRLILRELHSDGKWDAIRDQSFEDLDWTLLLPGGSEAILGSEKSGTLRRWNYRTGAWNAEIATRMKKVWSLEANPDGSRLVVAGPLDLHRGLLQLWDLRTGSLLAERETRHIDPTAQIGNPILSLAFSPDGTRLVTAHGQDFTVRLWDARSLEPLATMQGHTDIVRTAAFSPDGARIATGADDYTIRLWDAISGEPLLALRTGRRAAVRFVAFTPEGGAIVSMDVPWWGAHPESVIRMWRTHL